MGRAQRPRPTRLAEKLLQIRRSLRLSQQRMLECLSYQASPIFISHISQFEANKREPPLLILLRYARVAGVSMETLVDDELDLPEIKRSRGLKNLVDSSS